jgi:hypothetical protein
LLKIPSPPEVAIKVLSSVQYPSFGCIFVVFHQIIHKLDDFLQVITIVSHASLALSFKTYVLRRRSELQEFNSTLSFLSISVDPKFKLAYIQDAMKAEQIKKMLFDQVTVTYPNLLPCISKPDRRRKRAQNVSLHDFLPLVVTTEGPKETIKEEPTR